MALIKLLTKSKVVTKCIRKEFCPTTFGFISNKARLSVNALKLPIVNYDAEHLTLKATMPGFTYTDLDNAGNITVSHISKFCETFRIMMFAPCMFPEDYTQCKTIQKLFHEGLLFLVASKCEFFPGIYDKTMLYKPIEVTDSMANIGTSSFSHINTGVSLYTKEKLYQSIIQGVFVDMKTRKPAPLPQWFAQYAKNTPKVNFDRVPKLHVPHDPFIVKYVTQESDTDYYNHMNHSKYALICHNVAAELARNRNLSSLHCNISRHQIKSFKGVYLGESCARDELEIRVWESHEDLRTLHFDVYNLRLASSTFQGTYAFEANITPSVV